MRRWIVPASILAALSIVAIAPAPGYAQGELPHPPIGFQPPPPPPPPPVKPYSAVSITPPGPDSDPGFAAFRKDLANAAEHKDRGALAKLIVAQGFFWVQDKNLADKNKSGVDNLAKALDLDNPDSAGWDALSNDAEDPTLAQVPEKPGLYCAPAPPKFDPQAFENLVEQTDTEPIDWGYPTDKGLDVRAAAQPNAQIVEKLGLSLVRVLPDSSPAKPGVPSFLHVALPDGKTGYVVADDIEPLLSDQICYTKQSGSWKIAGYIGGAAP